MDFELINYFWAFIISLMVFFAIDLTWLGWVAKDLYRKQLKKLLMPDPNWPAAILFYVLFIVGLNYFVIVPALRDQSLATAIVSGALYGFFTYATYDLTNYATLKGWPRKIVIVDIAWGTFLSLSVSVITYNLYIGIFG